MSTANSRHPRVIFIGNIPFEITEEQVIDIFKEVGPVLSFRLMFDRETGRSRGYAFCEYADSETAASAIRNLSGYEIGGRHLKVDKADNDMLPSATGGSIFSSIGGVGAGTGAGTGIGIGSGTGTGTLTGNRESRDQSILATARPIQNIPGVPTSSSTAAIHSLLSAPPFTNPQTLLDLIASLKTTIQGNPDQVRHLLATNPALSYSLLQCFISLGLIDMSTVQSLLLQSQQAIQQSQGHGLAQGQKQPQFQAAVQQPQIPQSQSATTATTTAAANPSSIEQQRALIMQIMGMTPDQINLLPPQQRDQVLQLKQQILLQQQQQQQQQQQ